MAIKKTGISISEETYEAAKEAVATGEYRNISHVFEIAVRKMLGVKISEGKENPDKGIVSF